MTDDRAGAGTSNPAWISVIAPRSASMLSASGPMPRNSASGTARAGQISILLNNAATISGRSMTDHAVAHFDDGYALSDSS
jgi:hypothetical protein